jgi:DNA-binding NtrC family response regulator
MVKAESFREDLYYRLNVVTIALPPLRERRLDIPILIQHFLRKAAQESGQPIPQFSPEAERLLLEYPWPGNIRELANVVERAVVISNQGIIPPDALPPQLLGEHRPKLARAIELLTLDQNIDRYVRQILEHTRGNRSQAARILGISRRTLHRMETRWREETAEGGDGDISSHRG